MKVDQVANSKNDEYYTPEYAVKPILKYIQDGSSVWCPFDTEESHFVKMLEAKGCLVQYSHLDKGEDFFLIEPPKVDFIVSNPPYSCKGEVIQRLFELGTPFAMLVGVIGLFESQKRFDMFKNNKFEIMYLNRRVSYFQNYEDQKPSLNPPFSSVFICSGVLPNQIVFEEIDKKDSK
jgi:hypothetical protein